MSRAYRLILRSAPLLLLAFAAPLPAQTIHGRLAEEGTGHPVSGAIVVLLDENARQVAGVLTNDQGAFEVRAPTAGVYRLRADRIGYASTLSARLELSADEVMEYPLQVTTQAVELKGITASGERRCDLRPAEGLETQRVWDEARKALTATALTTEGGLHRFRIVGYERELDPQASRIRSERTWSKLGRSENPFVTLPPEVLAEEGYARTDPNGTILYAPDARVLLSDPFLDTHCFRIDPGGEERTGQIGLGFEPVRRRNLTDVEGVLWVDRATAELRALEYRYTNMDPSLPRSRLGGRVEFERLPGGSWITRRWWIRMPITAIPTVRERTLGGWQRMVLVGIKEDGGEVVEVLSPGGARVSRTGRATLSGSVFDSTRSAPIVGATVYLSGTQYSATTDAQGRFRIDGLLDGEYSVSFMHPRLDSLGMNPPLEAVSLRAGEESVAELALPPIASVIAFLCPDEVDRRTGVVVGSVLKEGVGVPDARVSLSWRVHRIGARSVAVTDRTARTHTDRAGKYRVCGIPLGASVTIEATAETLATGTSSVVLDRWGMASQVLHLGNAERVEAQNPFESDGRSAPVQAASPLAGTVTDAGGSPIASAAVSIVELGRGTLTDASGSFRFPTLPTGTYTIEARHIGYAPQRVSETIEPGRTTRLSLVLEVQPVALEGVEVVGEPSGGPMAGFYERRNKGFGLILTREDIEAKRATRFNDIFRGMPGIVLTPTPVGDYVAMTGATGRIIDEGGGCPIQYYLDGAPFEPMIPGIVTEISPAQIEGLEVYRRLSEVPGQYRRLDSNCGVILIWTR